MSKNKAQKLGFGTAAIGRPQYINIKRKRKTSFSLVEFKKEGWDILELAYKNGIRYFDTAPGYGMAEQLLIEWAKTKRDNAIEIASKWGYVYKANFDLNAVLHEVKEHTLNRLNTQWITTSQALPYLSTYQIHSATFETGVLSNQTILERLYEMKNKHQIKIGLTSTGKNQKAVLEKAINIQVNGEDLFDTFQLTYNILDQSCFEIASVIAQKNKRVVIKEAVANGRLMPNENYPNYSELYQTLQKIADHHNVGIDAIALRFCMDTVSTYSVLSGAALPEHLVDNLKSETFHLTDDEIDLLKSFQSTPEDYWQERKQLEWK